MTQYAFYFDSSACSGCKACQIACKDRHGLEVGLLWRRVYEVAGGEWRRVGDAWAPDVYAYNLSMACNHCEKPICAEVCPSGAIYKRSDGIVLIDEARCIGCKYCSWACAYGAPQYNITEGHMTKCNFCVQDVEAGLPPACVAACPMRVLEFGERLELEDRYGKTDPFFPLPQVILTEPTLVVTPHKDACRATQEAPEIANREEV